MARKLWRGNTGSSVRVSTVSELSGNVAERSVRVPWFALAFASISGFSFSAILPSSHFSRFLRFFCVSSAHCLASSRSSKENTAIV